MEINMQEEVLKIADKFGNKGTALYILKKKKDIISDHHRSLLAREIWDILCWMPDCSDAKELRQLLRFVRMSEPKVVTTTLYGHA